MLKKRIHILLITVMIIMTAALPVHAIPKADLESAIAAANAEVEAEYQKEIREYLLDSVYPVGSVYSTFDSSMTAAKLSAEFGGEWVAVTDRFLFVTSGDTGTTGGEATHTLTTAEIPSHSHGNSGHLHYLSHYGATKTGKAVGLGSGVARGTNTVTETVSGSGSSWAHNNMPPYITVKMFKRTA